MENEMNREEMVKALVNRGSPEELASSLLDAQDPQQVLKFEDIRMTNLPTTGRSERGERATFFFAGSLKFNGIPIADVRGIRVTQLGDGRRIFNIADNGYWAGVGRASSKYGVELDNYDATRASRRSPSYSQRQMTGFIPDVIIKPAINAVIDDVRMLKLCLENTKTTGRRVGDVATAAVLDLASEYSQNVPAGTEHTDVAQPAASALPKDTE